MSPVPRQGWAVFWVMICLTFTGSALAARPEVAAICDSAALVASRETGVPVDVLRAISLTETGRRMPGGFLPWPWTVNMEGVGKWFDDVASAQDYVDRHFARGARSFDVGCFQINYRWHGAAFSSIEEMFDPIANARYAARFLSELYSEFGDWSQAAGAYHSRTRKYATKYSARFDRIRSKLPETPTPAPVLAQALPPSVSPNPPRENSYPLFRTGATIGMASLVSFTDESHQRRLIDFGRAQPLMGEN